MLQIEKTQPNTDMLQEAQTAMETVALKSDVPLKKLTV